MFVWRIAQETNALHLSPLGNAPYIINDPLTFVARVNATNEENKKMCANNLQQSSNRNRNYKP